MKSLLVAALLSLSLFADNGGMYITYTDPTYGNADILCVADYEDLKDKKDYGWTLLLTHFDCTDQLQWEVERPCFAGKFLDKDDNKIMTVLYTLDAPIEMDLDPTFTQFYGISSFTPAKEFNHLKIDNINVDAISKNGWWLRPSFISYTIDGVVDSTYMHCAYRPD